MFSVSVDAKNVVRGGRVGASRVEVTLLDETGPVIHRNIFGHFAEPLGRCIDAGISHRSLPLSIGPLEGEVTARVLTAVAMNAQNSLEAPDTVSPAPFVALALRDGSVELEVPTKALVTLSCGNDGSPR